MNTRPNPYVGPRSLDSGDVLYGREHEMRQLEALLIAERTVLLHSPSGAGKTSLIRAGLIPRLTEDFSILPVVRVNLELTHPGDVNRYLWSTLYSLEEGMPFEKHRDAETLATLDLDAYLKTRPRSDDAPDVDLLIFDQFEEILTTAATDQEGKHAFFAMLGAALKERNRWALFAIREDYLGALAPYLRPLPGRLKTTYRLDLLKIDAAREAIQSPPRGQGVTFTEAAAEKLVRDLSRIQTQDTQGATHEEQGEYVEPVQLQVVCFNLWQNLSENASEIDEADLAEVDSVDESLAGYYAGIVAKVAAETGTSERDLRTWFDTKLLTGPAEQPARGQVRKGPDSTEGLVNAALDGLVNAHIIRAEPRAGAIWYELAHDRLIGPVRSSNRAWFDEHLKLFQRQALLWDAQGRSEGLLLRGKEFKQAEQDTKKLVLTKDEINFLDGCKRLQNQIQLRRWFITGFAVFSLIILSLLVFALAQLNLARAQRLGTEAQAAFAAENYNTAFLYAYQSNQIAQNDGAAYVLGLFPYQNFVLGKGLLGHTSAVTNIAWSADGRLASASGAGTLILWDLQNKQPAQTLRGHTARVSGIAWSADGRLASGSYDGTVILWDLQNGRPAQTLRGPASAVTSIAWSADGQLASGSSGGDIILWDLQSGQPTQTLKGQPASDVRSLVWSADGRLASGSSDGTVILWDLQSGQPAQTLKGPASDVRSLAWSVDGRLASASDDGTVILWDLESGQPTQTLKGSVFDVTSVAWSADAQLASGSSDGTVILWDLQNGRPAQTLRGHTSDVTSIAWATNDGQLASGSVDGEVIVWDLQSSLPAQTLKGQPASDVRSLAWSADGQLASGSGDSTVILWDLQSGQPAQTLRGHTTSVSSVAWSRDGLLASGSANGEIILWDLQSGQPVKTLKKHTDWVSGVAWSADGRLASGSYDNTLILWDLQKGQPAQTLRWHRDDVTSVAWSADGRLASGSLDGEIILWDLQKGQPSKTLRGDTGLVNSLAWSADGRLASGFGAGQDSEVVIWDLQSGRPAQTLRWHTSDVTSVAWSADGRLASGSSDGTVILWDLQSGQPAQILRGHISGVSSIAWSADGRLASGSWNGHGRVQIARADVLLVKTCETIFRNMSITEWLDYQGWLYVYQPTCPNLYDPSKVHAKELLDVNNQKFFSNLMKGENLEILLITWSGRAFFLVDALVILLMVFLLIRVIQKGSAWWSIGVISIGVLLYLYLAYFSVEEFLFSGGPPIILTIGFIGLLVRFVSKEAHWSKIILVLGFLLGNVLIVISFAIALIGSIVFSNMVLIYGYGLWGISFLALILWLFFLCGRWIYRKYRG